MNRFIFFFGAPVVVLGFWSCQSPQAVTERAMPFAVRGEFGEQSKATVFLGITDGLTYDGWFGPRIEFRFSSIEVVDDPRGGYILVCYIVEKEWIALGLLTEKIAPRRMVIEIGGKIFGAPHVDNKLPWVIPLQGLRAGLTEAEVASYLNILQEAIQPCNQLETDPPVSG